jgi:tetratricopeptide (TPR) repeat protein
MDVNRRSVALYGRFSTGFREYFQREIAKRGGAVARDLTRRSDVLVVGGLATALVDSGSLAKRLSTARARAVPVMGERRFANTLMGEPADEATLPLAAALAPGGLTSEDASILAAFDLIALDGDKCRFGDAGILRAAGELMQGGRSRGEIVRILVRARDLAPRGRHKIVLTQTGDAALQWDNGLTTLEGQGYLPLESVNASVEELFERGELAEAGGNRDEAARLFELCATADRDDPIAPFNLGNVRLAQGRHEEAARSYQRALARDPKLVEARYNLALALEASEKLKEASEELARVLRLEPTHQDAMFNRAQLLMKEGALAEAKALYERYLALDPPADWAATARKAITYCTSRLSA